MSALDYLMLYALMGLGYALPKLAGFLNFLSKEPGWHEDIPGPAWMVSLVAALIITSAALIITVTWPAWMAKSFFSRGK